VVVVPVVGDEFIALHAVQKIHLRHNALLHEEIEFTIYGGLIGPKV
jgi:hypothetical protein